MHAAALAEMLGVSEEELETVSSATPDFTNDAGKIVHTFDANDLTRRLCLSCEGGHADICNLLIAAGSSVNRPNSRGHTPLFVSSDRGHLGCVNLLLSSGALPASEMRDGSKRTALHAACKRGNVQVVRLLVEAGALVDHVASSPWFTPLHSACRQQHVDVAALLLDLSASVDAIAPGEESPSSLGNMKGNHTCKPSPASVEDAGGVATMPTPLAIASAKGHCSIVALLIDCHADVSRPNPRPPLLLAVEAGHVAVAEALLKANAAVDGPAPSGCCPLWSSCTHGQTELVRLFISH